MPPLRGTRPAVLRQVRLLLGRRVRRTVPRVEAHRDDLELLARVEGESAQRGKQAVQHLRAEHRAVVVRERENHGPAAEVLAEPDGPALLVLENQVERNLRGKPLLDPDVLQHRRPDAGGRRRCEPRRLGDRPRRAEEREREEEERKTRGGPAARHAHRAGLPGAAAAAGTPDGPDAAGAWAAAIPDRSAGIPGWTGRARAGAAGR